MFKFNNTLKLLISNLKILLIEILLLLMCQVVETRFPMSKLYKAHFRQKVELPS